MTERTMIEYTIDLDHRTWMPVPVEFPWNGYADDEHWAADLAASLLDGFDADDEVVDALRRTALTRYRTASPLPGAVERFWHFPEFGGEEHVAHLYLAEIPADGDSPQGSDAALRSYATAGVGGYVQVLDRVDGTEFDAAAHAVVIGATGETPLFVDRCIGIAGGYVFILDVLDENAYVIEGLQAPLMALFRSIRLRAAA